MRGLFHILQYVKERIAIIEVFFLGVGFGIILAYRRGGETPCCRESGAREEIEKAH